MLFRKLLRGESIAWPIHRPETSFKDLFLLAFRSARSPQNVNDSTQMHVFVDACKEVYATCIFFRSNTSQGVKVALVRAKARVAPLKQVTIPRLELMVCCIGASEWRHVPGKVNPANLNSQGCSPSHLVESHWWLVESPDTWPITELPDYDTSEILWERKKVRLCNLNLSEEMLPWYASDGGPPFHKDYNSNLYIGPVVVYKQRNFWECLSPHRKG
ncbi:integrase catalytic domain-containing protein [Trichonephila clavipes]|uniref:Integrase catalytic domain-containing protein n=1 Tax=Trichonephila clavipes TaxID=2585209 RepID=A0A8X7B772_TRICX|nr:integrase catalytic domain-containing protein [Trichonephila clavipes]